MKDIKELLEKLLSLLKVEAEVSIKKEADVFNVDIDSKNAPLLIGFRGETLMALEYILNLLVRRLNKDISYVQVDVSGYRKEKEEKLKILAFKVATKVKNTKKTEILQPMNPAERRLVHMFLSKDPELTTESIGEDPNRKIVVKVKQND